MQTVYIETTIVSYLAARPSNDPIVAGRQQETRSWWEHQRTQFSLYTSELVEEEAQRGDALVAARRRELLVGLPVLAITHEVEQLANLILREGAVPESVPEDAVHVAICAVNRVDFLLTWNCRHLANALFQRRLIQIFMQGGYIVPTICTPEELAGTQDV